MQSKGNANIKGIDVSNWQGDINFAAVKASGVEIVYMKASEGDYYKDKFLDQNYKGAKAQGLKVGFYHFFRANVDATAQARFFVDCIQGKEPDCRLVLDIETTEGYGSDALTSMCCLFLQEVGRLTGKDTCVYTYTSFAKNNLTGLIGCYPLWIAEYSPAVPSDNPIWNEWIGFQYASDGQTPGVNGNCDVNQFTEHILLALDLHFKIDLYAHVQDMDDMKASGIDLCEIGTTGKGLEEEALSINIEGTNGEKVVIKYGAHMEDVGDIEGLEGQILGSRGQHKELEGLWIKTLEIPGGYKIQYQVHLQDKGWSDWIDSPNFAGSRGEHRRMEAFRVRVVKC